MASELESDLEAACEAGEPASVVVGPDVRAFARDWATERDVVRPRPRLGLVAAAAVIGAIPGAGFALFIAYGISQGPMAEILRGYQSLDGEATLELPVWLALGLYVLGAAFACAGGLGGVAAALLFVEDPAARPTIRALAIGLPAGTALAVGAAVAVAAQTRLTTGMNVGVAEAIVAAGVFAIAAAAIRWRVVRGERLQHEQAKA
jgi:hypothetical protein